MKWLHDLIGPPAPYMAPKPPTALQVIERELERLHEEMDDYRDDIEYNGNNDAGYHKLVDSLDKLNAELIRRSQEESKLAGS